MWARALLCTSSRRLHTAQTIGQDFCDGGNITDLCKAMHRAGHWASTHLVLNAINMHTSVHLSLLPTSMHDPDKGIVLTSDFEARALSMPAGPIVSYMRL
jgi:hypothetical protein